MNDDELNHIRQLIDSMQSGLVELFDQLRELREKLHLISEQPLSQSPSVVSLFSEIKSTNTRSDIGSGQDTSERSEKGSANDRGLEPQSISHSMFLSEEIAVTQLAPSESVIESVDVTALSARVSRVLDPITQELETAEATADIIMEYLQSARAYLIDNDERKEKVAQDIDIVLNFLKARGSRSIRAEERDNILKRIRRWKAHLVSYSDSPAE